MSLQKISQVLTNGKITSPTNSTNISVCNNKDELVVDNEHTNRVISLYGYFPSFMAAFNPSKVHYFASQPERCVCGISPSLKLLCDTYGKNKVCLWIASLIGNINLMALGSDTSKKMTAEQIADCAKGIVSNYDILKAAELMLFISRLKAGKYGKFYGVIDGMTICNALNDYLKERNEILCQAHNKLQESIQEKNKVMIEKWNEYQNTLEYAEMTKKWD